MNNIRDLASRRLQAAQPLLRSKQNHRAAPSTAAEEESFADVSVRREAIRQANHRDGDRHRLDERPVDIIHDGQRQAITLINLSGGGAMIEGAQGLKLWDHILLQLGDSQVEAAVRWIRGNRHGLEFAHETRIDASHEAKATMLRAVISRSFPDVVATVEGDAQEASAVPPQTETVGQAPKANHDEVERDFRHPLIWSGFIHHDHQTLEVRLRNISAGGALVECDRSLPVGAELLLELNGAGSYFATVNWAHGDVAGLHFQQPFDLQHLAAARPTVAAERWVAPDYLRDSQSSDGPWAKQWGRSNLADIHRKLGA